VAVALGNTANPAAVPALTRATQDADSLVRSHAAWALGAINDRPARNALERARQDADATVRDEVEAALAGNIGAN
jgi:epoxyqueuosine reductase